MEAEQRRSAVTASRVVNAAWAISEAERRLSPKLD
jgi:hypothetical protein